MPVYERTYRSFDGELQRRFRWVIVARQELKVLIKSRIFLLLVLVALLHFLLRFAQVVQVDVTMRDPNNPLAMALRQIAALEVSESLFFSFLRIQTPLVFFICLSAGSGMICSDFSNNLMEIYFSKPISWIDYTLGKALTLIAIGLAITAVPALFLVAVHNLLVPGMDTLRESYWWPGAILACSLAIVLPCALCVLASSALVNSRNAAWISLFLVLTADAAMGGLLDELLANENYSIISFPMTLQKIGQALFRQDVHVFSLHWGWALLFVVIVCLGAAWIISRRVRRAEIAS